MNNNISKSIDVSDVVIVPSIVLYSPNGGETLMKDEWCIITWEATANLGENPIDLQYSVNGGTTWKSIASSIPNSGHYNWTVPDVETETGLIKVTVNDIYGAVVSDVSDRTFAIDPPPGGPGAVDRVISPGSGDELITGEETMITWKLSDEVKVAILHSTDFGQSWEIIVENIINGGIYRWRVPEDLETENAIIKVQGVNSEVTSGFFMIGEEDSTRSDEGNDENSEKIGDYLMFIGGIIVATIAFLVHFIKRRNKIEDKPLDLKSPGGKNEK